MGATCAHWAASNALGDIVLVRPEQIIRTRLTIPQGIQIVLSGGISIPQILRQKLPGTERR